MTQRIKYLTVLAILGLSLLAPYRSIVNMGLAPYGLSFVDISGVRFGGSYLRIKNLSFAIRDSLLNVTLQELQLDFSFYPWELTALTVSHLEFWPSNKKNGSSEVDVVAVVVSVGNEEPLTLDSIFKKIDNIPIRSIDINRVTINSNSGKFFDQFGGNVSFAASLKNTANPNSQLITLEGMDHRVTINIIEANPESRVGKISFSVGKSKPVNLTLALNISDSGYILTTQIQEKTGTLFDIYSYYQPDSMLLPVKGSFDFSAKFTIENDLGKFLEKDHLVTINSLVVTASPVQNYPGLFSDFHIEFETEEDIELRFKIADPVFFSISSQSFLLNSEGDKSGKNLNMRLNELNCEWREKVHCHSLVDITATISSWNTKEIKLFNTSFSSSGKILIEDSAVSIDLNPTTGFQGNIELTDKFKLSGNSAFLPKGLEFRYDIEKESYNLSAQEIQIEFQPVNYDGFNFPGVLQLSNIVVSNAPVFSAFFSLDIPTLMSNSRDSWMPMESMEASFILNSNRAKVDGFIRSDAGEKLLGFTLNHNLLIAQGEGQVKLLFPEFSLKGQALSDLYSHWPFTWDIQSGRLLANVALNWKQQKHFNIVASSDIVIKELAGHFENNVFAGLNSAAQFNMSSLGHFEMETPACVDVDFIDLGIPITTIEGCGLYSFTTDEILIQNIKGSLLGGKVLANGFVYDLEADSANIDLKIEGLDIEQLVSLTSSESIEANGSIMGHLPITIVNGKIAMEEGNLYAQSPGGVIRYIPKERSTLEDLNPALQLVNEALQNYHFESMHTKAQYTSSGDLELTIKMKGENPDMNDGQKINLNLNVSDNIPVLLKSLQTGRVISDLLQERLPN